jgi:hypothetical protein
LGENILLTDEILISGKFNITWFLNKKLVYL